MAHTDKKQNVWHNRIALFIFGVLIAVDFGFIRETLYAIGVGIVIAILFVLYVKLTGIEPGWPKE